MILQTTTTSFKIELLQGVHNFGPAGDTFKIALYTGIANLGFDTTVYTSVGEVVGNGYAEGGNTLVVSTTPTASNNSSGIPTAYISFETTTWSPATFTTRAALIYNASQGNKSVAVLDFGSDKTAAGQFQITFPTADANSAIVRIS